MPDSTRHLWQLPTFLLGLAAFLGVYQGWLPIGAAHSTNTFESNLSDLRVLIAKPNPDVAELRSQLKQVATQMDGYPQSGPAGHFALGSGYVRLAERTPDPTEAQSAWALAKQHFDRVKADQLPDPVDGVRLAYRGAKARAAIPNGVTQAEAPLTVQLLMKPPPEEVTGDAQRLVGELCLRNNPPLLDMAKSTFTAYLAEAGLGTPPATIARTKLKLSDVLRQLGDIDGAKKWLAQINTDAPADVLAAAKAQLARIRMDEGDYRGARRDWEVVLAQPNLPAAQKPAATYQLGMCFLRMEPKDEAAAARRFEEIARADGPEGMAASVRLAELRLKSDDAAKRKDAAALLAFAVKSVQPGDYPRGALLPIQDVQAAFESAIQTLTFDGAFESAAATAEAYRAVAVAGRDREKHAETFTAWAAALQKSGSDPAAKLAAAADDYAALAKLRTVATDQADLYRKAAALYKQAGNSSSALESYKQIVLLPNLPNDVIGPVWIEFAESLLAVSRPEEAQKALQEALLAGGSAATTARYRIARHLLDTKVVEKMALGVALMDQVAQAEKVSPEEQTMHERALVDVAHAFIQKGNFAEAESRLAKQIKLYPTGGEASLGRLLLGVCLLQQADARAKPPAANPAKNREEALGLFKQVIADVDARAKENKATDRDPWLRAQSNLRVLQSYQQMGRPYDVLKEADLLRREVSGTVDELVVMSLMYHAYKQLDKPEGSLTVHTQMREVFDKLKEKPGAFWAKSGEYSREYWERVWFPDPGAKKP